MKRASRKKMPLLQTCGNYDVWAQMDVSNPETLPLGCFYPQVTHLQRLHDESPNATFLLNRRNYSSWFDSVDGWRTEVKLGTRLSMSDRLARCKPFGPKSSGREDLIGWHEEQVQRVRRFVIDHPSHALVEVDIEDEGAGGRMARVFRIDGGHWGHENRGS